MGVDRWLAMVAVSSRFSDRCCIVDAGTALTIDFVSSDGTHEGGYIIPGRELMERALLGHTDRVRFSEDLSHGLGPGKSTAEAVRNGVALAQAGAVRLALESALLEPPRLIFTGGGGELLKTLVGKGGHFLPDIVFEGLSLAASEAN